MKKAVFLLILLSLCILSQAQVVTSGMTGAQMRNALNTKFNDIADVVDNTNRTIKVGGIVITANATELNILDGILATTTELNRLVGVTSSIQTQLDSKAPIASPTITGTATIKSIVGNSITADNGTSLSPNGESITLTGGNPYSQTYVSGGDIVLKGGNAIYGGSTTEPGHICLVPGRGFDFGSPVGTIELGNSTSENTSIYLQANGTHDNINLSLIPKGTGWLTLGGYNSNIVLHGTNLTAQVPNITFDANSDITVTQTTTDERSYDFVIKTAPSVNRFSRNSGNIYLYGGTPYSDGTRGGIYFGDGSSIATLPTRTTETNVIYYNTTTGQLSYGDAASGGSMTWPSSAGIAVYNGSSGWGTSITDNSTNWNTAYSDRLNWDGGSTGLTAATGRTSLGATTVGSNLFTLTNPGAITFLRLNADNTVSTRSATEMRSDLSLGSFYSPLTGSSSITTLGTVTTGIWNSTAITDTYISSAATWNAKMVNPMTTAGDIIYGGTSGAPTRLAKGTDGYVLTLASGVPTWAVSNASITYPGAGIPVSTGSAWGTSITDNHTNWDAAYTATSNGTTLTATSTELNYVHGVTSAIQDQLDTKASKTVLRNDQTARYTLVLTDAGKYITMNVATANNLTIPLNSSVAFPTNTVITIKCIGAGKTTIVLTSGVTGISAGDKLGVTVHGCVTLVKLDTNTWAIDGTVE